MALDQSFAFQPIGIWVKQSKRKDLTLCLFDQDEAASIPQYGCGASVEGTVNVAKFKAINSVELKVDGWLHIEEIAEGGAHTYRLLSERKILWSQESFIPCPPSLPFNLMLRTTFQTDGHIYPLPPTFDAKLASIPGFRARAEYSVSAIITKVNNTSRINVFRKPLKTTIVHTTFRYHPRTRPPESLPPRMSLSLDPDHFGVLETPEWSLFESKIAAKSPAAQCIFTKLYLPASRVFCAREPIPFHLVFHSSALSLASFLPYAPGSNATLPRKRYTFIQVVRQIAVDAGNTTGETERTGMWRADTIGEGSFQLAGDGPDWISFQGDIIIDDAVQIGGFKACGLSVKDAVVLSVHSPARRDPFKQLRHTVPIRLTTDAWLPDCADVPDDELSVFAPWTLVATEAPESNRTSLMEVAHPIRF